MSLAHNITILDAPACNIDSVTPYVIIQLGIANHTRGDVPVVHPNPDAKKIDKRLFFIFFMPLYWPEDEVELDEALVEVIDASLEGKGKLHQLHKVLVLVAVLLSDENDHDDDDDDDGIPNKGV